MTFVPHVRLTMSGTIGPAEQFSCSLSLVPQGDQWQTGLILGLAGASSGDDVSQYAITNYLDEPQFQDIVSDCSDYWSAPANAINALAKLTRVKMVTIGSDGRYVGNPREAAVNVDGGYNAAPWPNQIARKITLLTNGDLGRVKGGWYMPLPAPAGFAGNGTDLWSAETIAPIQAHTLQFVENLNNAPGFDAEGYKVVVASQGRHNPNGSVRRPPTNHEVYGVSIGRRPDVQRRRANKVLEERGPESVL